MALIKCAESGQDVSDQAAACPKCGHPAASKRETPTGAPVGGAVMALIGGGLMATAPVLPWVTAGVLSASGLQKTGNEAIVMSIFGLLGGALTAFYTFQISEHLDSLRGGLLNPQLGIGIYVAFGGAALLFIGALMAPRVPSAKKKKAPKSPPGAPS